MTAINKIDLADCDLFNWACGQGTVETAYLNDLDLYAEIAGKSAIYPGQGTPLGLAYVALKLNGEAGEFAEHVGKAMRDDSLIPVTTSPTTDYAFLGNPILDQRREALIKEAGDILWYLAAAARELDTTLSAIASGNLEKLRSRTARDKLSGSGDDR